MTYIVSGGALNSTHSFANAPPRDCKCPSAWRFFSTHRRLSACNVFFRLL